MSIDKFVNHLIEREGGYVNNPKDKGGPTRYGITLAVARANGYKGEMIEFPISMAQLIYKKQYWLDPRFDKVFLQSPAIAEELLDTGVNCGISFAKPLLQRALNLMNNQGQAGFVDLDDDGVYGKMTLDALAIYLKKRGTVGEKTLLKVLNILQGGRYIEITERNPAQKEFFYGWITNRIEL